MTEDDIQFVREISKDAHSKLWHGPQHDTPFAQAIIDVAKQEANLKLRLLTLLVEAEARGDKAEFEKLHDFDPEDCEYCGDTSCDGSGHFYTDSDWEKAVRKRWKI